MVRTTFGTAFVLSMRHRQTLSATRKVSTMFFKTKRSPRKTTRQTLSTEQLEPKAMFSVSPVEPVVSLDVGPVNQTGDNGCSIVHPTFRGGEDGRMIVHPAFRGGEGGRMIVHPEFSDDVDSLALTNHSPSLIGDSDRPGDVGTSFEDRITSDHDLNDITLRASANPHAGPEGFMKLGDIKGEFQLTQHLSISTYPNGSYNFMPKPNRTDVWTNGSATSLAPRHAAFAMMGQ